jgi:hypothetical protein
MGVRQRGGGGCGAHDRVEKVVCARTPAAGAVAGIGELRAGDPPEVRPKLSCPWSPGRHGQRTRDRCMALPRGNREPSATTFKAAIGFILKGSVAKRLPHDIGASPKRRLKAAGRRVLLFAGRGSVGGQALSLSPRLSSPRRRDYGNRLGRTMPVQPRTQALDISTSHEAFARAPKLYIRPVPFSERPALPGTRREARGSSAMTWQWQVGPSR